MCNVRWEATGLQTAVRLSIIALSHSTGTGIQMATRAKLWGLGSTQLWLSQILLDRHVRAHS